MTSGKTNKESLI